MTGTRYATADLTIRTTSGSDFEDLGDIPKGTKLSITGVTENSARADHLGRRRPLGHRAVPVEDEAQQRRGGCAPRGSAAPRA